ncbi:hypothetical protein ES332_D02G155000v1 [Gossypium tomentosum]|uniref:Uncharacterized protein n=1 Tax=Gossypium tomentosum TaxID=34277 RepID=A0A5D2LXL7_GOSTO|nr:hypothetical protein ES332_D02G155000v1 [Gossypium tomentosum]
MQQKPKGVYDKIPIHKIPIDMNLLLRGFWIPKEQGSQRHERTSGSGIPESSQGQTEQTSMRNQSDREHTAFGLPAAVSFGNA